MLPILTSMRSLLLRQSSYCESTIHKLHTTAISEAARKGTREKARKKKVKVEVKKVGFIPHNQRGKKINLDRVNKHFDDSWKQISKDNVWVGKYYRWPVYTVQEAIQCHRETHHPTMFNVPNAPVNIEIELNMRAEKSTRFLDNFHRMAMVPHKFDHGQERTILVFTKGKDEAAEARKAGATHVGGIELIKDITAGELLLTDYQYIIAHPNILAELVQLRGLMKRKFPNPKSETLGVNLTEMIHKFSNGISYSAVKDEHQQDYCLISTCVGKLDMNVQHLEDNLSSLLKDVNVMRPKRDGVFISRVIIKSPPSSEQLKIDPFVYVPEFYEGKSVNKNAKKVETDADDEEKSEDKLSATN